MNVPASMLLKCFTESGDYVTILSPSQDQRMKVELSRPPGQDTAVLIDGLKAVSCGPRVDGPTFEGMIPQRGQDPEFFAVLYHHKDGETEAVADLATYPEALSVLRFVVASWIVKHAIDTGITDLFHVQRAIDEVTMLSSMSAMGLSN